MRYIPIILMILCPLTAFAAEEVTDAEKTEKFHEKVENMKQDIIHQICFAMASKHLQTAKWEEEEKYARKYGVIDLNQKHIRVQLIKKADKEIAVEQEVFKALTGEKFNIKTCTEFHAADCGI